MSKVKSLKKLSLDLDLADKKLQRQLMKTSKMQENIQAALTPLINSVIIDGTLLKNISLISGQVNVIDHKLAREIIGYIVIRKDSNSNVWDSQKTNNLKNINLKLHTDNNCEVDLWVF